MIKIKVPATSANIGPGFDSLGLALNLFNTFKLEKRADNQKHVVWEDPSVAVSDDNNLMKTALEYTLKKHSATHLGYDMIMGDCKVPMSRGLGSSATAIVAGVVAANYLLDFILSDDDLLLYATELEGHPDNVAPALLGSMIISQLVDKRVIYDRIVFPKEIAFKVMVPDFKLSTAKARSVLPDQYSKTQCIFNISRVGLLISSLYSKKFEVLKDALDDAIHQPYRLPLIPSAKDIFKICDDISYGSFISGAGPTLISLVNINDSETFDKTMLPYLEAQADKWTLTTMQINLDGTTYTIL
jgi:homoserine kinase